MKNYQIVYLNSFYYFPWETKTIYPMILNFAKGNHFMRAKQGTNPLFDIKSNSGISFENPTKQAFDLNEHESVALYTKPGFMGLGTLLNLAPATTEPFLELLVFCNLYKLDIATLFDPDKFRLIKTFDASKYGSDYTITLLESSIENEEYYKQCFCFNFEFKDSKTVSVNKTNMLGVSFKEVLILKTDYKANLNDF